MKDISDSDYRVIKRACKDFKLINVGVNFYDMCIESNTLLLTDVFENSRNIYFGIYQVDHAYLLSAPVLVYQVAFKKKKVKLDPLTNIDMLLIVKKVLRAEYVMTFIKCES